MSVGRTCLNRLGRGLLIWVLFHLAGSSFSGQVWGAETAVNLSPGLEGNIDLDYRAINESLSLDLNRGNEILDSETIEWKVFREDLAKREQEIKKYRIDLSAHAKGLISGTRDLKKLESDWNSLKPKGEGLDEPVRQMQKRIELLGEELSRVEEESSLNTAYSREVLTAVDPSHPDTVRIRKNFKALDRVNEKRKQALTYLLEAHRKTLADIVAVQKEYHALSQKYSRELADRKKQILFEKGRSPLGSISPEEMTREMAGLYQRGLAAARAHTGPEQNGRFFSMHLAVFILLLVLWFVSLIRLRWGWDQLLRKQCPDRGEPLENFCLIVRKSMIPAGLAAYFFLYGVLVQELAAKTGLILVSRLIMAFLFIDWVLFFLEVPGKAREHFDARRLLVWNLFLRGLFPVICVNLIFDLIYAYNHMIPVFLRLFMGCYLLAGFFVMTFRLRLPATKEGEPIARPMLFKLAVSGGKLVLLSGLLMELFGYGAFSIFWYLSWVYTVAIFIWSWHLFCLLLDFRSRQKEEVTRDPYFSEVVSHGHPVKWFLLQGGWFAWLLVTLVLVVLAWSRDWQVVVGMFTFLHHPFQLGSLAFSIMNCFYAVLTVAATHVVTRVGKRLLLTKILVDSGFDSSVQNSISMITVYTLWMFGILLALHVFGLGTTSLTVAFGALGIGLGFGLQNIFNNFISGIILLFERPIQVGDDIEINGTWARVRKINVRSTVVQTYDNASLIIPNSDFISAQVINWTLKDKRIRRKINVGVAYGSDIQLVRESLLGISGVHRQVLAHPRADVLFADFGDSALVFVLRFWTNVDIMLTVETDLRFEIDRVFKEKGIVIAFPQLDLHLDKDALHLDPGAEVSAG